MNLARWRSHERKRKSECERERGELAFEILRRVVRYASARAESHTVEIAQQ